MQRKILIAISLFVGISAITQDSFAAPTPPIPIPEPKGEREEFNDVPYDHWAYPCVRKLHELLKVTFPPYVEPALWTRYEFAIFLARLNDQKPDLSDPTAKDILYTLNQEFAVEIRRLTTPYPFGDDPSYILESRVARPPKLTIAPSVLGRTGYESMAKEIEKNSNATKAETDKTESPAK